MDGLAVILVALKQEFPNLLLEGHCPAKFSSNLPQCTCLEVSSMPKTLISWLRGLIGVGAELC